MKVLIACEFSGVVREAFRARGHDAWSCDLVPAWDQSPCHLQMDVAYALANHTWDLMIAHPPCTYLAVSGAHLFHKRQVEQQAAANFFLYLMNQTGIPKIAVENPVGIMSTRYRKPDQIIQPYQFGEDASKKTCLWLKGLPKLRGTRDVMPRTVNGKARWANQTDSGQNRLGPSPTRSADRAKTYQGIADAMAEQWGGSRS